METNHAAGVIKTLRDQLSAAKAKTTEALKDQDKSQKQSAGMAVELGMLSSTFSLNISHACFDIMCFYRQVEGKS